MKALTNCSFGRKVRKDSPLPTKQSNPFEPFFLRMSVPLPAESITFAKRAGL